MTPAPASRPPHDLDGLDPRFSRLVSAPSSGDGVTRGWHLLDNADALDDLGVAPIGTVLCVHGNPTWSYLWRSLLATATDAAAAGDPAWRVVAVDQLDMGFSERTGAPRTLAQRVRDLGDLTDALDLAGPVVTLGHDWGGVVAFGWAVDHPQHLAGVMSLNTAVHQPDGVPIPAPLRVTLGGLAASTVRTPAFLETTLGLAHPALTPAVKAGYRAPYRTADRRGGIGGFVADIPADLAHDSRAELDRVAAGIRLLGVPALLLWGPRDPIFGDRYLDDLAERMPHADIHRFEGAGHLIAEDVDYAPAVLDWLGDRFAITSVDATTGASTAARVPDPHAPGPADAVDRRPLWHHLDTLADSDDTALVEMKPPAATMSADQTIFAVAPPRVVSWRLLSRRVRELAAGLRAVGVEPGHRVSLLVPPGADLTAVLYACLRIGATVVVADAGLGIRGLTRAVRGARPDHLIGALPGLTAARALGWPGVRISTTRLPGIARRALGVGMCLADVAALGRAEPLDPSTPAPPADAPAAVLFTSGSTGPAKGAVYTRAQLEGVRDALARQYGIGVGTGLVAGFAPFALLGPALGATSATPDMDVTSPRTLTARAVAAAAAAVEADVVFLSPAAVANVVATASDLSSGDRVALARVRTMLSAGAPIAEPLLSAISAVMPAATAHTPYGMTEGLLLTDIGLDGIRDAGPSGGVCVGRPASSVAVAISALDDLGVAVGKPDAAPDVTGEIVVSAPHLFDHYDRLWLTDRASRRGTAHLDTSAGRWHRTGDVGHLDAAGRLWVEGRLQHVIATASGVVTPVAPEQRIERIHEVGRAAIVGIGPVGTQQVVAVVESSARHPRLDSAGLAAAVRSAVQPEVALAAVIEVPILPTDIRHNSKIDRTRLARWAGGVLSGGRMTRP
ncbi:MAG: hypothetical protein RI885_106 [Actinomycetota bacterium]